MLRALVKARFAGLFGQMFRSRRGLQNRSPFKMLLIVLAVIYVFISLGFSIGMMFKPLLEPLHAVGLDWLYFALMAVMAFGIMFVSTLFMTQSQLYEATDNELLLAMPIPPQLILISRLLMLLAMNLVFELLVVIPAVVVYWDLAPLSLPSLLILILAALFLPLLSLALSSLVGWLLATISARVQRKSLITTVFSIAFLVLYFWGFAKVQDYLEYLITHGTEVGEAIRRAIYPAYLFGTAVAGENWLNLLLFAVLSVAVMGALYLLLAANFRKIVSTKAGSPKRKYRERPLKVTGPWLALVRKEITYFFGKPMYILNASLGAIFSLLLPFVILFQPDLLTSLAGLEAIGLDGFLAPLLLVILSFLAVTNIVSAPSISLEGKKLWILQSSPIRGGDVLLAKAAAHLLLCALPSLFAGVLLLFTVKMDAVMAVLLLVTPFVMNLFQALFGVTVNLHFPKFDWINETVAIKQSLSTFVVMLGGMAIVTAALLLYIYALADIVSITLYIGLFTILMAAICVAFFLYLRTKGSDRFASLAP